MDNIATIIIKRDAEGVVIDVYRIKETSDAPVASTWAHDHDLCSEEPPTTPVFTPWQRTALISYQFGEFAYLADAKNTFDLHESLRNCGDSLLRFIVSELSAPEDCGSYDTAIHRMIVARNQLNELIEDLQAQATDPTEICSSPRFHLGWFIDSDAATPEAAALEALHIQRTKSSIATVFKVREKQTGNVTTVDLANY